MSTRILMQTCIFLSSTLPAVAQDSGVELYFSNDSLNGFQLSDAYETHDMGVRYTWGRQFLDLNLGLVSPDMLEYRTAYRTANRSFGELVKFRYGLVGTDETYGSYELMGQIKASGRFGFDDMQDFMHDIFGLQKVGELEGQVRMPSTIWFGVGAKVVVPNFWYGSSFEGNAYLGSDRASIKSGLGYQLNNWRFGIAGEYVFYDNVVSAAPIYAAHSYSIPSVYLQRSFRVFQKELTITNNISLPTISSDDSLFASLNMHLKLPLK